MKPAQATPGSGKRAWSRALALCGRFAPELFWARHARLARRQGIEGLSVVLSFDCDTDRDLEVVAGLADRLGRLGLKLNFAVPGELLERGRETYARLARDGHHFLNHGYRVHTRYEDGAYVSSFSYDRIEEEEVVADIRRGDAAFAEALGRRSEGFRAPHFGTFQRRSQLAVVHSTLRALGYRYSTSTMPEQAFRHGPLIDAGGLREIPLTGCYASPFAVLDSWSFRHDPARRWKEHDYHEQLTRTVDLFLARRWPGILNYYADPSQVDDFTGFHEAMGHVAARSVPSLHYSTLAG